MTNIKHTMLFALSIVFLLVGVLGTARVEFFTSNTMLELVEIVLGVGGLLVASR